ncbi:uncharacterized protein KD926_008513 [Aspergillus affinis]|uniref:uncharacterized protein n=1 Tax=Aspergillus affinis TaxID=1070780 RepID=UPI0022FF4158|nr:uncharacterized protein KD926_008513 [Aspergillus affinis]KAI9040190.1 hypothetical protein KD926_008513 [Aspergillus affinis]
MNLRNNLVQREVFVCRYNTRNPLYNILSDIFQQDEFHEWTDEELKAALEELDLLMITAMLRKRLNLTRDSLKEHTQAVEGYSNPSASLKSNLQARRDYPDPPVSPEDCFATPKANPSNSSTPGISHVPEADYLALETNHVAQENNHLLSMRPKNDLSKEIASVTKIYTEDQKYSGTDNNSLDFKLNIFYDICSRAGLLLHGYKAALPTMLKGVAEDHYYSSKLSLKIFQEACYHLRQFFEGPEFYRQNLTKWNVILLQKVINDNSERLISIYQGFQLLLSNLLKQRYGLYPELRSNINLINKLITACQGVPACRIAIADLPEDLAVLINKLQSSISTWEKENPQKHGISHTDTREEAFYTDRRYYNQNRNYNQGKKSPAGKCYIY